jgi:hypothetical protein
MKVRSSSYARTRLSLFALAIAQMACWDSGTSVGLADGPQLSCNVSDAEIHLGNAGRDAIPALTNPLLAKPGELATQYVGPDDRVIGLEFEDVKLAVPLNILWWHEIVNFDIAGRQIAVTHCPLTGSSLVFDRASIDGAEFGVTGLLLRNNLIMYDRSSEESMWPQMARRARCGVRADMELRMVPSIEMTMDGWETLHPNTLVVTSATGFARPYHRYPYGTYRQIDNPSTLFPLSGELDPRRPPKERTLGIPDGDGGRAFPYGELEALGSTAAVDGDEYVVFWDSVVQAAMAYRKAFNGLNLDFLVSDGRIRDVQTGTEWRIDGLAVSGLLAGGHLDPVPEAYVSYWFAWAAFQPNTTLWNAP